MTRTKTDSIQSGSDKRRKNKTNREHNGPAAKLGPIDFAEDEAIGPHFSGHAMPRREIIFTVPPTTLFRVGDIISDTNSRQFDIVRIDSAWTLTAIEWPWWKYARATIVDLLWIASSPFRIVFLKIKNRCQQERSDSDA